LLQAPTKVNLYVRTSGLDAALIPAKGEKIQIRANLSELTEINPDVLLIIPSRRRYALIFFRLKENLRNHPIRSSEFTNKGVE
jgi:hypothetical protein